MAHCLRSLLCVTLGLTLATPAQAWAQRSASALSMTALGSIETQDGSSDPDDFSHLTFRQRERFARRVFRQAEAHKRAGQLKKAADKYRQTYRLVPHKHGLAFIIGMTYKEMGLCADAGRYFNRLIKHGGTEERLQDKIAQAQATLQELKAAGCLSDDVAATVGGPIEEEAPLLEDPEDNEPEPEPDLQVEDDQEDEYEEEEESTPVYDGPTVDQAQLDENPLGPSSQEARDKSDKAFRRANSRGFFISGIIITSLGGLVLGGAGFLHWKTHDTAKRLVDLTDANIVTRFPTVDFNCRGVPANERSNRCPRTLIKDFEMYQQYTPIAYGVGGGLVGLGLTFILIKQIRMAKYRRKAEGSLSWHHPDRLNITPYRAGQRVGAQASLRF